MIESGLATSSSSLRIDRCISLHLFTFRFLDVLHSPNTPFKFYNLSSVARTLAGKTQRQKAMDYLGILHALCTCVSYVLCERDIFSHFFLLSLIQPKKLFWLPFISLARFTSANALAFLTIFLIFGLFFCVSPRVTVPSSSLLLV